MKIIGDIRNSDYVNCFTQTNFGRSKKTFLLNVIYGIILALAVMVLANGNNAVAILISVYVIFLIYQILKVKIWIHEYLDKAECNNSGKCEYEIIEGKIFFRGNTYDCVIPISAIREVINCKGTWYLKFGNASGFIVPHIINSGSIDEFISDIQKSIELNISRVDVANK